MKQEFIDRYLEMVKLDGLAKISPQHKQQRGRDFEDLINEVFEDEKIMLSKGYHTSDNSSEQIDGAVEFDNRIFLVEIKWVESNLAASELYAFIGKIENKFFGTLGIFISKAPLSDNFINSLNKGRRQSVIVIHGDDITHIFSNHDSTFKEYFSYVLRVVSYDNKTHLSFKDFLNSKKTAVSTDQGINKSPDFIKSRLIGSALSEALLIVELEDLATEEKDAVYKFIITNYARFWKIGMGNLNFTIVRNFDLYLKNYQATDKTKTELASTFYSNLLLNDVSIYHEEKFIHVFSNQYVSLSDEEKDKFEDGITKLFAEYNQNSNWTGENYITEAIAPIWFMLKASTREELKGIYLSIYIRHTLDKFPQKKFANMLVEKSAIDKEFAESWLDKEISNFISDNGKEEAIENSTFLARTYYKLLSIIAPKEKWVEYIDKKIKA
ncbi:restriction endonuclease [Flavobacterium sp. F52]|uniref:restriction endonuclease n=1 Tax=Flavobacterium sp. F52 TaxID=1202532 RepID=UPI000272D858|nr:restriction endonuclease [Flavobacterium sp. F52]EJG03159.1 hypothetical protein FF52_03165 [Flavobacterium sp. F52]